MKFVADLAQRTLSSLLALPEDFRKTLKTLDKGELKVEINGINQGAKLIYQLGQQVIFTLLTITSATISYLFYQKNDFDFAKYSFIAAAIFLILLFWSLRQGRKIKKNF